MVEFEKHGDRFPDLADESLEAIDPGKESTQGKQKTCC